MVGKKLSHYRILEELGRGGMGIVYKAEDTKLDRLVAIKVLPAAALASEEDRERFFREAKAAAQLHHPHIASVFGIDEAVPEGAGPEDTRPFIAMEFVEGETLFARIQKGPLKLSDAVRIAAQIASGLEAAHEKNIVHRDIKSGNIMLTAKGDAKILDFGLAQTAQSTKLTRMGSTLGTVAYMSPEQARGEEVDGRSDLYSLGTVLYEMIAGRLPFAAEYEQAAIYSILNEDPEPLTAVRTGVPMALEGIVSKALRKDASLRYQTAGDLIADLRALDLRSSGTTTRIPAAAAAYGPEAARRVVSPLLLAGIGAAVMVAFIAGYVLRGPGGVEDDETLVFTEKLDLNHIGRSRLAPDGRTIAFVERDTLWARKLDAAVAVPVARVNRNIQALFWSPSSERLGFVDGDAVRTMAPDGSNEIRVGRIPPVEGVDAVAWSPADSLYLLLSFGGANSEIASVPATGGALQSIWGFRASVDSFYVADMFWHEPTSSIVVVKVANTGRRQDSGIGILNPHDDRVRSLNAALGNATGGDASYRTMAFDPAGYLLLGDSNGNLWALRVDSETLDPEGRPQFVRSGTRIDDVGANGLFLGGTMRGTPGYDLVAFDPDTRGIRQIASLEAPALFPSISDDGQFLAGTSVDTYVINLERGDVRRVYDRVAAVSTWLPDDLGFTAANYRSAGGADIYRLDPDGVSEPDTLIAGPESEFYAALSPDRTELMYYVAMPETGRDLWIADVTIDENGISVEGSPREWYAGSNEDVMPAWHPDGNWVLYAANQTGQYEVYVRAYPSAGNERRVSLRGGYDPAWSPHGDAIYYRDADSLYTVRVLDASSMRFSDPVGILDVSSSRVLFNTQLERSYAVNPVSGELLMNRIQASTADFRRLIIVNWRAMLSE